MNLSRAIAASAAILLASCTGTTTKPDAGNSGVTPVADFAEVCKTKLSDCRGPGSVRLKKEDGKYFELTWTVSQPVVQDDTWVTIFPGETIYLEADVSGDRIVKVRAVPVITNAEKTITLSFEQSEGETSMLLSVSNPFSRHLKYRLGMEVLDREGLFKTSSCPAVANGGGIEHWGFPIFQLVVTDFRLIPENSNQMTCD